VTRHLVPDGETWLPEKKWAQLCYDKMVAPARRYLLEGNVDSAVISLSGLLQEKP
jgi:hypothetical protein